MKKKIATIAPIATLGIISSLVVGTVVGQVAEISSRETTFSNKALSDLTPRDFISQPLINNRITNDGNTNYQFQDQIPSAVVNNPEIFNRNNVLSTKSTHTVRSEHFYFNFIKPASVGANGAYNIVSTPVNPGSRIQPQIFNTLGITLLNGSAIWLNDTLFIAGQVGNSSFDIVALKVDNTTGILSQSHRIVSTSSNSLSRIFNLSSTETKVLTAPPGIPANFTSFIPETVSRNPVNLSPITNYQNPNVSEFVAWTADINLGGPNGLVGANTRQPVVIKYSNSDGFIIEPARSFQGVLPALPNGISLPQLISGRVKAITPIRYEDGALELYIYSYAVTISETVPNSLLNMYVTRVTVSNSNYIIKEFLPESIVISDRPSNMSNLESRDSSAFIPYALPARGDEQDPTETSSKINLLFFATLNSLTASNGIPSNATNIIIDTSKRLEEGARILSSPPARNLSFFEPFGTIFTNFADIMQLSYGVGGNLQDGISTAISYRGVSPQRGESRVGTIKWQEPWNPNLWSSSTLFSGTQILRGNTVLPIVGTNSLMPDVTGTIYNGILSTPGIYEPQIRATANTPLSPARRTGVIVTTKDLNNNDQNIYNTSIPRHIILAPGSQFNPEIVGTLGIGSIISQHTKDFPLDFSEIIINESIYNENADSRNNTLDLNISIENPYIDGLQSTTNNSTEFLTTIQEVPTQLEIENPISTNNVSIKSQMPSISEVGLQQAFLEGNFNPTPGIIGSSNRDLIQIPNRIIPFINNFKVTSDNFLGTMTINYTLSPSSSNSLPFEGTIIVNGFFGLVYIIPIVLGSIILIGGTIGLIFFFLHRKHNENLKASISSGFKLYSLKNNNDKSPLSKKNNMLKVSTTLPASKKTLGESTMKKPEPSMQKIIPSIATGKIIPNKQQMEPKKSPLPPKNIRK